MALKKDLQIHMIEGDKNKISNNGKILKEILDRHDLSLVKGSKKCSGLITRMKKTVNSVEESIIDYIIVCRKLFSFVTGMIIDDKREKVLTNFKNKKKNGKITESDHNIMESFFLTSK